MNKVVHCKLEPYDVYIGRPSKWGNPFSHKKTTHPHIVKVDSVETAVAAYAEWIKTQPHLLNDLHELKNKVLGCWCKIKGNEPCHGDILVQLVEFICKE